MKKLFTLFALTLVAAISVNASAQSLVGRWEAEAGGGQYAMLQAVGGEIEEIDNHWTFSNDNAYNTHSYIKASIGIEGVVIQIEMELNESGSWKLSGDDLTLTSNDFDVIKYDITFSDPSLNSSSEMIKSTLLESINSAIGANVVYDIEFKDNNTVELEYDNDVMPLGFTLKRTR
jgi:hypothetical protein